MTIAPGSWPWTTPVARPWPRLVAEDLRRVPDPLAAWLRPPRRAPAAQVASCLAHALLPDVAPDEPPPWIRSDQRLSFGRALAAVRRLGGALLADGVGSGKTWIGLAVAAALEPGQGPHVIAPATLRSQWAAASRRAGVPIRFHSHETLSRGRAPSGTPGPVIVDECHRFRNPVTRRYDVLCRWCAGRRGILLSATPVVNRLDDLEHQLLLLVRHDSLSAGLGGPLVTGEDRSAGLPERRAREVSPLELPDSAWWDILEGIRRLRLSRDAGIASLIRVALLEALASSPTALAATMQRYQALLQHGGDAEASGIRVSRGRIRQLVGRDLDQLVLWPLVAEANTPPELDLTDLPEVARLIGLARQCAGAGDAKLDLLRELTADGRPTLVFATSLATVRYLRRGLGRSGVAWCTGKGAGLDHLPVEREVVLDWFRHPGGEGPTLLLATDVASEGLDLPRVERVVHYDLPWTAVRLEQRTGRAVRLLSGTRAIEEIRFCPPPALERQLDKLGLIHGKAALVEHAGLGGGPEAQWRRCARLAARWKGVPPRDGLASVQGPERVVVAGVRVHSADGTTHGLVRACIAGEWTDDESAALNRLEAATAAPSLPVDPARVRRAIGSVARMLRPLLRPLAGQSQGLAGILPPGPAVIRRLRGMARSAFRARRRELVPLIDRGIRLARGGLTAGERRMLADWAQLSDRQLLQALAVLPAPAEPRAGEVELFALLLVEPAEA